MYIVYSIIVYEILLLFIESINVKICRNTFETYFLFLIGVHEPSTPKKGE